MSSASIKVFIKYYATLTYAYQRLLFHRSSYIAKLKIFDETVTSMLLNYKYDQQDDQSAKTLVLIHGLFGSLSNLGMLARAFVDKFNVLQIDLRNHGDSFHESSMTYLEMAQDVIDTLDHLNIQNFSVIGHSMGGKVAMQLTQLAPSRLHQLVVLDMAPFAYPSRHHDQIFEALKVVADAHPASRQEATELMQPFIKELGVIQFLLKSFHKGSWKFNLKALWNNYDQIIDWNELTAWQSQVLFIRGANSDYLSHPEYIASLKKQFPNAIVATVNNAGHWLHAEKTDEVIQLIDQYLSK